MIIFKKKNEKVYVVTNYKVMFSTLNSQPRLKRVSHWEVFGDVVYGWINPRIRFYLLVRNPFERTLSFFKDKFLKADRIRVWMNQNNKGKWQKCTEHFFPYLDLNMNTDPLIVSKKLMSTPFEKFLEILPHVFLKDEHMQPQFFSKNITLSKFKLRLKIPIKFKRIFKMESNEDLNEISKIFNIDLGVKKNNSGNIKTKDYWNVDSIRIIEDLYSSDIKQFEYNK